ncbi:sporulation integral membrane protein YtvI [Paludifilum halophilum]|uniref:Sporulation integral membrane protein YtvI n=1 Tax=Paludifilum halophilum TaxID=1642702 RepID=A0A235B7W3_9BACL|nr:sporulation integral membrane protein YtvI [Paludifilum halophilum]OYD08400.1 sporulation integral membrane protein YtvI [Paludifilum halophilum]
MNRESLHMILRALLVVLITGITYYLIVFAIPLTYPFIIGWLIATIAEPVVRWLERRARMPRWAGVTLTLFLTVGLLITLLVVIASQIVIELTHMADLLPVYLNEVNQYLLDTFVNEENELTRMIQNIQNYMEDNPEQKSEIMNSIRDNMGVITNRGTQAITDIIAGIGTFLGNLPYYATVLVFSLLAAFFIGLDWPRLKDRILGLIPERIKTTGGMIFKDLKQGLLGFVRAQLTLITITGIIVWIGLLIMQVEYATTIALITAAIDLLPYFGVGAVLIPWAGYLFITGNIQLGVGIAILYIITLVARQMLEPKLVASNIGLNPLLTLIALFIGLKWIGVLGLIIGPVVAVVLVALHRARIFTDLWHYIRNGNPPSREG